MSVPSPFEMGKSISESLGGGFKKAREKNALEEILAKASEAKPEEEGDYMSKLLLRASPDNRSAVTEIVKNRQALRQKQNIKDNLIKRGINPLDAELYAGLTTGGKTQFTKDILESRKRGTDVFGTPLDQSQQESPEDIQEKVSLTIKDQDVGLTPKEKVERQKQRYATGLKPYQESMTKLKGLEANSDRFKVLDSLNKSDKLPKNLGRLNVDKHGNLRVPFLASPESQRFIKTLNEFAKNAKDTYGARVTNFELTQFLKQFPTLLNTKEGRRQVLQQMRIVNDINTEYYKNLRNIYKQAGGVRNIDADLAQSLAEDLSEPKIEKLRDKFDEIGLFTSLPNASQFKGKKIRNKETGEILISDGEQWKTQE